MQLFPVVITSHVGAFNLDATNSAVRRLVVAVAAANIRSEMPSPLVSPVQQVAAVLLPACLSESDGRSNVVHRGFN